MDELNHTRLDLINSEVHTTVVWLLALGLIGLLAFAHWFKRRLLTRPLQLAGFAIRIIIATVALWAVWQAFSRVILLTTNWALWTHAFIGGLAIEIVLALYQLEKRIVSARVGRILLGLRLGAIAALLVMLVQPVFGRDVKREETRTVTVLIDDSASMQIADKQMSVEERVSLAQFYGIDAVKNRPALAAQFAQAAAIRLRLERMAAALEAPDGFGADAEATIIEKQSETLAELTRDALLATGKLRHELSQTQNLPGEARNAVNQMDNLLKGEFENRLRDAENRLKQKRLREARSQVQQAITLLSRALERSDYLTQIADNNFYQTVAPDVREKIDAVASRTRAELARETMERPRDEKSLLEMLKEKYTVQLVRFGRKSAEVVDWKFPAAGEDEEFRLRTDLTSALQKIQKSFEAENLAGVLLLSDVRHNTDLPVDDVARQMGNQKSPICSVVIGSQKGSKDAAIVTVQAPQAIYQGDRIRAKVELRAHGLRGQKVKLQLLQDGGKVAEETITVPEDSYRTTVRMAYLPKEAGIFSYSVKIDPIQGELFSNNNEWSFKTAVSDDRTNVLLVDDRPRWEFRYLRNLFDSRDKSVHLQYYLLHPDQLEGEGRPTGEAASAARKFGESEAGKLPEKPEDWKKFDAIILGDVPPSALGEQLWETIRECVEDRGALLVLSAGQISMPHAYANNAFREMCPVLYEQSNKSYAEPPEKGGFRIERTAEGLGHLIMEQSRSLEQSREIWESMPLLQWRHPIQGVKEGADVLAYAKAAQFDGAGNEMKSAADSFATFDPAALQKQKDLEKKNALVVVSQFGTGKVAMLLTDHTWRFRYGVGDTYHHKFWGQLLRWGTGDNLRAGTELVRLGTEKLTYEAGEEIKLLAKLQEQDYRPVAGSEVIATVFKGSEKVLRRKLEFRSGSHGMYEAMVNSLTEPGDYRLELSGPDVDRLFRASNTSPKSNSGDSILATQFTVASALNPVEFGDLSVDRELAARLASLSGGTVATPADATKVLECFGPASKVKEEYVETRLWDNWGLLAAAVALLTAEWIYRRRGGLI